MSHRRHISLAASALLGKAWVPTLLYVINYHVHGNGFVFAFAVPNLVTGHAIDHAEAAPDGSRRRVEAMSARCRQTRGREKHDGILSAILDDDPTHGALLPGRPDRLRSRGHQGLHGGLIRVEERGHRHAVEQPRAAGNGGARAEGAR